MIKRVFQKKFSRLRMFKRYLTVHLGLFQIGFSRLFDKNHPQKYAQYLRKKNEVVFTGHLKKTAAETEKKRETFNMFWHGDQLSALEMACMRSFLDHGHALRVFTYQKVALPEGAINEDASQILPLESYFSYQESSSAFSNIFRYKLLLEQGGWWVDTDVVCLKSEIPSCDYFWAEQSPDVINSAVLKFPIGDPRLERLLLLGLRGSKKITHWGQIGPELATNVLADEKPQNHLGGMDTAYPVHFFEAHFFWLPEYAALVERRCANSFFLHLWHSSIKWAGIPLDCAPPPGSFLNNLYLRHGQPVPNKPDNVSLTRQAITQAITARIQQSWVQKIYREELGRELNILIPTES